MNTASEKTVSANRQKKMVITDNLEQDIEKAKSMVITDYRSMNTNQLGELRQKLADKSAKYMIAKNTLMTRALRKQGYQVSAEHFEGPSAILFSYQDEVEPIKVLFQFVKTNQLPKVKGGYLGKAILMDTQVETLSKIPSRQALLGQVVGTLNSPIQGLVTTLQANIQSLLYLLSAISDKK